MGVRDLFPTLRKLVPDSITPVESLAQLGQARSKFAIDGNLLTTKFHFSPSTTTTTTSDHHHAARHRHVKGWYAFLRGLERRGIEAVVVFDGPGRILEKERERERRRVARELQKWRGEAETVRKRRLENLRHLWRRESESRVESSAFDPAASDVVKDFIELYDEYERDRANPIYSRYQDLITKGEGQVFRTILERAPSLAPVRDRVDRSRREEPRIDQLARGLETILAGTTSSSREETNATPPSVELEVDGKIGSSSSGASSVRPLAADDRARASLRSEPKSNIDRRSSRFEMTTRSISNRDFEERDVESFALGREPTGQQPLANDDETYTPSTTTTTTTTGRRLNVVVEASTSVLTTAPDGSDDSLSIRESPTDEEGSSQNDSNVGPSLSSSLEENPRIGSSHDHSEEVGPGLSVAGSNPAETVSQIVVVGTHSRSLEESPTLPFGSDVDPGSVPATTTTTNTDSVRPLVVNPAAAAAVAGATTKEPLSSLAPPPPPVSSSRSRRPPEHEVERDLDELITESSRLSKSHLSRSVSVPLHVFSDCKALISSMGYPVLTPSEANPYEAESICSVLYHRRAETGVTHVVSEDTDVVVYSAPLLRRVSTTTTTTTTTKTMMTVTDPVKVRTGLGLNDREFLDFCLLCGTDFTDRLPLLGPTKALGLIRKYGSIESIFERDENVRSRYFGGGDDQGGYERWLETVESARRIFLELPRLDEVVRQGEVVNFFPSEDKDEAEAVLLLSSRWFDKKRERKQELVELKRRFGITVDEDEEDVDDDDELVLASMRRQDDFLASIWLSEQGEEEEDDEEES